MQNIIMYSLLGYDTITFVTGFHSGAVEDSCLLERNLVPSKRTETHVQRKSVTSKNTWLLNTGTYLQG
jgi:hypothetical protein